jgi:hypothetical protein
VQEEDRDEGRAAGDDEEREACFEGSMRGLRYYRQCHPWVGEEVLAFANSYVLSWVILNFCPKSSGWLMLI